MQRKRVEIAFVPWKRSLFSSVYKQASNPSFSPKRQDREKKLNCITHTYMESFARFYIRAKPFLAVILLQFGYAGMSIFAKFALNKGMSPHVFSVYRHAVATIVVAPFALILDRYFFQKIILSCFFFHAEASV